MIKDFVQGEDKIQFTATPHETFIGTDSFTGVVGQFQYAYSGNNTLINLDNNGDKIADGVLELTGHFVLTASDFVL